MNLEELQNPSKTRIFVGHHHKTWSARCFSNLAQWNRLFRDVKWRNHGWIARWFLILGHFPLEMQCGTFWSCGQKFFVHIRNRDFVAARCANRFWGKFHPPALQEFCQESSCQLAAGADTCQSFHIEDRMVRYFFRECKGYFKLQKWPSIQIDGHAKIASLLIKPEVCLDTLQIGSLPSIHDMIWQLDISPVLIILIDLPWKPETPSDIATWHWWCLFVLWPKNDPKRRMFLEATNLPITGWRLFLETYWKTFSLGGMITCQKGTDC